MSVSLTEIRDLPQNELIELVADLWEVRPDWRTMIVEPGDEIELEIKGDLLEITVPNRKAPHQPDVEVTPHILAIQESPTVKLSYIHVRTGADDKVERVHLRAFSPSGVKVKDSVIVTTGTGPDLPIEEWFYVGDGLVDGEELCDLIDQYSDSGFEYEEYL